jgi:hypothetical protein
MFTLGCSDIPSIATDECDGGIRPGADLGPFPVKLSLLGVFGYGELRIGVAVAHGFSGVARGTLTGFAGREGCNGFLGGALAVVGAVVGFSGNALVSESGSTGWATEVCVTASSTRVSLVGISFAGDGIAA